MLFSCKSGWWLWRLLCHWWQYPVVSLSSLTALAVVSPLISVAAVLSLFLSFSWLSLSPSLYTIFTTTNHEHVTTIVIMLILIITLVWIGTDWVASFCCWPYLHRTDKPGGNTKIWNGWLKGATNDHTHIRLAFPEHFRVDVRLPPIKKGLLSTPGHFWCKKADWNLRA